MKIDRINRELLICRKCPRIVEFREMIGREKRKQFEDWDYWAKPVPGYGDSQARLLILGLAPAAHGGNRTGRVFTGDKSAEFLFRCLHAAGMSNLPDSLNRNDGLEINGSYMTAALKCVPPQDKPKAAELANCFYFLNREITSFSNLKVILALGKIAFDAYLKYAGSIFEFKKRDFPFGHDLQYMLPDGKFLWGCYHPSPRNVNTGRLTQNDMVELLQKVKSTLQ